MSTAVIDEALHQFQWKPQPEAGRLVAEIVDQFAQNNSFFRMFRDRLLKEAGVRAIDLIDYAAVPADDKMRARLEQAGFVRGQSDLPEVYTQPHGIFPAIALQPEKTVRLGIKAEYVADFLATWRIDSKIQGSPLSPVRSAAVFAESGAELHVIERHGSRAFSAKSWSQAPAALKHYEALRLRRRQFERDEDGFAHAHALIDASIAELGQDYTCDLFFAAERDYWMNRNHAARVQFARQQRMGIGWANHDHHTYRSARRNFSRLVGLWEKLGFEIRERYHAGLQAGWGAQVMEQPVTGIITFNDVDLTPEELFNDFAHEPMGELPKLGTVGLWCELHGDSFLQAGMHHLEAMFDFNSLRDQLEKDEGVKVMKPFTNFPYLTQAFTEGERWTVSESRIARLLQTGLINQTQADQFRTQGALGSHLENLERNDGFKGFNQTGVSEIIAATDPRKHS
jgi:hypothetical protein